MPLVRRNGKLLRRNGKLVSNPKCCCDDPPPDVCPPCCVRVALGEFDSDGNLTASVAAGTAVVFVKVVLPTPHNRIVCDGQEITVQWEIPDHEGTGSNDAWMRFGPAWLVTGHSPAVNAGNGKVYDWGLVDWGNAEDDTYSVTLQFRKCFLDVTDFLGYIWIGMSNPEMEFEVEIERCETLEWCCRDEYECEDCCALLDMGGVIQHDNKFYKVSQSSDENGIFTGIVEIVLDEPGMICRGQGMTINVYLVPPRHSISPPNNMVIEHPAPWEQTNNTPMINPADGEATEEKTDWGTLDDTEYSISLSIDCPEEMGDPLELLPISIVNGEFGLGADVTFTECELDGCCFDCTSCPPQSATITVVVKDSAGSDGEYDATWDAGVQAWKTSVAGCEVWITCRLEFGVVYFDMQRGNPPTTGCGITVPCGTLLSAEVPSDDCCWYATPDGGSVSVKVRL